MKVLVACEESQEVTAAFIALGHDAMSCDFLPGAKGLPHYQGDMFLGNSILSLHTRPVRGLQIQGIGIMRERKSGKRRRILSGAFGIFQLRKCALKIQLDK